MLQQPRVPPTGQRQAVEIQIKWREVLAQKQALLEIMSATTGHSVEKLDVVGHACGFRNLLSASVRAHASARCCSISLISLPGYKVSQLQLQR